VSQPRLTLFARLARGWRWVAAQFILTLVLLAIALAWTRLPDQHGWQIALTFLLPILLAISALELQAGTVRAFADDDGRRVKLVWGAVTLFVWIAVGAACWAILDWCDDRIFLWAGYLNSRFSAHSRSTLFTYPHIVRTLTVAEWILRWIVIPGKLIALGAASSLWGWRLPVRRMIRFLLSFRWWFGVILAALAGVLLPAQFFASGPKGSVAAQEWAVGWKLTCTYLLAIGSWIVLLAWWATLSINPAIPPSDDEEFAPVPALAGPPDKQLKARAFPPPDDEAVD
jgi:hypothetical protein